MGLAAPKVIFFWIGLDRIHELTSSGRYYLEIILKYSDHTKIVKYNDFSVGSESNKYQLTYGGFNPTTSGFTTDGFRYFNDMYFSTYDRDNDAHSGHHCAQSSNYGWWFKDCHTGLNHSNGPYYEGWVGWYDESIMILKRK